MRYSPAPNYNGPDAFQYTIDDGAGHSATATVFVTVAAANDAPVAVDDSLVTSRDVPSTSPSSRNDLDVDGDALTVTAASSPGSGTASVNPDGSITYTSASSFSGSDGFDYTIGDGAGGSASAHVSVTVIAVNHAPVAVDDAVTTAEDMQAVIDAASTDTDEDGGALAPGTGRHNEHRCPPTILTPIFAARAVSSRWRGRLARCAGFHFRWTLRVFQSPQSNR